MAEPRIQPKHIEPEQMLDYLTAHILYLMDEGTSAPGLTGLLDMYFRLNGIDPTKSLKGLEATEVCVLLDGAVVDTTKNSTTTNQ